MNKMMKKIMASALALTIVGGGLPTLTGDADLFKSAIVANAEILPQNVEAAVGATVYNGNYLCSFYNNTGILQDEYYIYFSDSNGHIYETCAGYNLTGEDNRILVDFNKEGFLSESSSWTFFSVLHSQSEMTNIPSPSFTISAPADRALDVPDGLKITSGDGTQSNPFQLELVYSSETKPAYENVTVGKKWLIGDTINTDAYFKVDVPILGDYNIIALSEKIVQLLRKTLSPCVISNYDPYGSFYTGERKSFIEFNDITAGAFDYHYTAEQYEFYSNILFEGEADLVTGIEVTGGSGTKADPFTLAPITANQPKLVSNTMTLGSSISLNFYYDLSQIPADKKADTYVEFEVNGKKQKANFDANKMNSKKTAYGFTCMLTSVSMADDVKATMHYFDENGNEKTFVTTSNGQAYLQKFDDTDGEKTYNLVKAVNDFGYHLQKYLCNAAATPWTYGVDHVSMAKCFTDTSAYLNNRSTYLSELESYAKQINKNADINKFNYSLSLEADTTLIVRVKPEASYTGSLDITVTDSDNNPVAFTTSKMADGRTQVNIPNISAHKLGDTYTVSVKTTNGTSTFKASALSYVYEGIKDFGSAEELNAMCSIYEYYKKTIAFRTK